MIDKWNNRMTEIFNPSWFSCLEDSMVILITSWTFTGWMIIKRKHHPFGTDYHTISCGKSGISYAMQIVEGKDNSKELPGDPTNATGKTSCLPLHLTKVLQSM